MTDVQGFSIRRYDFNESLFQEIQDFPKIKENWPLVYILSETGQKLAYVGETADAFSRMSAHLSHSEKQKLKELHLISSDTFNKSATLDIEANLIKYLSGDGKFKLLNANLGASHNYYQKRELYWRIFQNIWDKLIAEGIASKSITSIENGDLFKYSPYKTLTFDQKNGVIGILRALALRNYRNFIVNGGAGTGKSIVAIYLCKLLSTDFDSFQFGEFGEDEVELLELVKRIKSDKPTFKIGLVIPMSSFRKTLKKVFSKIKDLSPEMVIGPAEVSQSSYDLILVDESHRLRRRVNLGTYFGAFDKAAQRLGLKPSETDELEWILKQSDNAVLFYDSGQSIKPSDVQYYRFKDLIDSPTTLKISLKSQLRSKGGADYVFYIEKLMSGTATQHDKFQSSEYDFRLFDSMPDFVAAIKQKEKEYGLSRMVAGYAWKWPSKNDKTKVDIVIDGVDLQWNFIKDDWINSPGAVDQVGCIHTTQGYDLNYAGVIFGNEITYNRDTRSIEVIRENYFDTAGKQTVRSDDELKQFILNIYRTVLLRGIKGTYIYVCDRNLREYFSEVICENRKQMTFANTRTIPLFSIHAAAGGFSEEQMASAPELVPVEDSIDIGSDCFALEVIGESMNRVIPNGSICLFRRYNGGSRNGQICLVELIDRQDPESGSRFTIKEYRSEKNITEEGWHHTRIALLPRSYDQSFMPIEIDSDEALNVKIVAEFIRVLN
jgi:DUF2075 family protein/predicted GIY-YIG superfamily endonuclease